jgi:hypothetical protein
MDRLAYGKIGPTVQRNLPLSLNSMIGPNFRNTVK